MSKLDEVMKTIEEILSSVSDQPVINPDRPFDSYGLDSLARIGLLTEIEKRLEIGLSVEQMISCETPRELADSITIQVNEAQQR